jgi:hypothetical protein
MKPKIAHVAAVLVLSAAVNGPAYAEYRCNPPPTFFDRGACEAAAESPAALRRYITRVQAMTNLRFADYVNHATVASWQASNLVPRPEVGAGSTEHPGEPTHRDLAATARKPR